MIIRRCDKCGLEVGTTAKPVYRNVSCSLNKPVKDSYGAFISLNDSYILCASCYGEFTEWLVEDEE